MWFVNDLDLKKQARNLGVSVWQTPGFLFIVLGSLIALIMAVTFIISRSYDNPQVLIISETLVAILFLVVGNSVITLVEQIARLNKVKSDFVSVASHQLRTPLSAIRWEIELLLTKSNRGALSLKQRKNLENIDDLSQRMTRLVNDLLDVARIDQNRLIFKRSLVDIVAITKSVVNQSAGNLKAKNVELVFDDKKKLPNIYCDSEKIQMVIDNLLSNSIKYTLGHNKIEIKLYKKANNIIFKIKDGGVGIPREQHSRVFEKFFRSDNIVKYQTDGTGLGLYIAKGIIEQMGGKIWFVSEEGLGSVFSFILPINQNSP
jgi:signal transduction histidine kinase